jgi:heavy metal sensor kinase
MRFRTIALFVFDTSARVIASSVPRAVAPPRAEGSELTLDPSHLAAYVSSASRSSGATAITEPDAEGGYRVELAPIDMPDGRFVLAAATSLHDDAEMLGNARLAVSVAIPAALLLAWLGGWLLAKRSLAPMVDIGEATATISAKNLRERVPIANPNDEVGQLATVINGLLDRLERAFGQQRQFMADASHELRTPVAILQGELDVTLSRGDRDAADYRESLEVMHKTVRRLTRIVRDLFLLARSDAGDIPVKREPLYAGDLVAQTARAYKNLAAERGVALVAECEDDLLIDGDEDLLQRMIGNLLENAIRHTAAGGEVRLRCVLDGNAAWIEVHDQGDGIPAEHREQIFERFFRVDPARTGMNGSGAGLGLSIARWIAEVHGGALWLERSSPEGSTFIARLAARR